MCREYCAPRNHVLQTGIGENTMSITSWLRGRPNYPVRRYRKHWRRLKRVFGNLDDASERESTKREKESARRE